jgi:hypothetical protein
MIFMRGPVKDYLLSQERMAVDKEKDIELRHDTLEPISDNEENKPVIIHEQLHKNLLDPGE